MVIYVLNLFVLPHASPFNITFPMIKYAEMLNVIKKNEKSVMSRYDI